MLDDVRIYNRELSGTEISDLADEIAEPAPGPMVRYKFDETTGLVAVDSSGEYYVPLPTPALDLHEDGKINFKDFALFAGNWLEEQFWP